MSQILARVFTASRVAKHRRKKHKGDTYYHLTDQGTFEKFSLQVYPWRFYIFGGFVITISMLCAILIYTYERNDDTLEVNARIAWFLAFIMFLFGLLIIGNGEVEVFKYNKIVKVLKLEKKSWFGSTKVKMKKSQIKNIEVIMKGEIVRLNNDIHYVVRIETIKSKVYDIFPTGDRKKAKQRYYQIKRAMGYKLEFDKLNIGKKLRNVDAKTIKRSIKQVVFEEDKLESTVLPSTHRQTDNPYKYKDL